MEQNEFYKFKKTIKNVPKQELARYNSHKSKEQQDEEEVESQLVDINKLERIKSAG